MKLKSNGPKPLIVGNATDIKEFGIADNKVMYDILRNQLYTNRIGAICREVASNSRDANRESGRGEIPIEIEIVTPNSLLSPADCYISFKDVGLGISPKRMKEVFLLYGASTKRNTNKQVGGFGIGAKTPFAYSPTFTIITIVEQNGVKIKYTYVATLNASERGQIVELESEPVEKTTMTGTQIIVPIKNEDVSSFEKEVYFHTALWDVVPKYIGFSTKPVEVKTVQDKGDFKIIDCGETSLFYNTKFAALIDGIPYKLNTSNLQWELPYGFRTGTYIIAFPFENGQLHIQASREDIQYDAGDNSKILMDRFTRLQNWCKDYIEAELKQSKSWLEATLKMREFKDTNTLTLETIAYMLVAEQEEIQFEFDGMPLLRSYSFGHFKFEILREAYQQNIHNYKANYGVTMSSYFNDEWKLPFYLLDTAKRNSGKHRTLYAQHNGSFVLVQETKPKADAAPEIIQRYKSEKDFLTNVLCKELHSYKEVSITKAASGSSSTYKPTGTISVRVRVAPASAKRLYGYHSGVVEFSRETKKANGRYIYLVVSSLRHFEQEISYNLRSLVRFYLANEKIRIKDPSLRHKFVVVSESKAKYFKDAGCVEANSVKSKLIKEYKSVLQCLTDYYALQKINLSPSWTKLSFGKATQQIIDLIANPKQILDRYNLNNDLINDGRLVIGDIGFKASTKVVKAIEVVEKIKTTYPLLRLCHFDNDEDVQSVNEYITLIDRQNKK